MSENVKEKKYSSVEILLLIGVCFLPCLIANLILVILGLLVEIFLIAVLLLAVVGVIVLLVGIAIVGIGIEKLFSMPMGAMAVIGFGICNVGVALLLECLVFWLYGVVLPHIVRKILHREVSNEEKA